ncbi:hypothetical protein LCGC14_0593070 [marine sediment metagenome]|uniref:Uncharacterized protein n=1 Tax=marine sediment metagenome TaxID=412755 RepID=A0A0F9RHQ0_9ZZZZ
MEKKLDDMTRRELLEMYEARGGKLSDFDKSYVNRSDLLGALEELDDVMEQSASFDGPFEFVDEEEAESETEVEPARSDQWYIGRGLQVPRK